MRVHEIILRALSGELTWLQAADILRRSPRSIRRLRLRFTQYGYEGLYDGRRVKPLPEAGPGGRSRTHLAPVPGALPRVQWAPFLPAGPVPARRTLSYTFVNTLPTTRFRE